jgi:murein DD-endopeptidase MepM/ murein hydrolase activator NlpD
MRVAPSLLAVFAATATPCAADDFRPPRTTALPIDWRGAVDRLRAELDAQPAVAAHFAFSGRRHLPKYDPRTTPALVALSAITDGLFPGIGRSAVPVLLPIDLAAVLAAPADAAATADQAAFRSAMFDAGPAGYDAVFTLDASERDGILPRVFAKPVEVQITGSNLIYDIDDPLGGKGEPVTALAAQFPDLRRFIREGYVRYAFSRFGAAYVVAIQCLDSVPRPKRLACREAYPVAERFIKALRIAGGLPSRPRRDVAAADAERPAAESADFAYLPSGDIVPGSGFRKQQGRPDPTVYSQIRFPLEKAPAFARSQSERLRRATVGDGGPFSYPWRDNFCESRNFGVGQCAAGFGHQGQDISPGECLPGRPDCDPKQQGVVAVRDGVLIRSPRQQAVTLQVNSRTEHIRFRYMHMEPAALDASGILNGRRVFEGERLGAVGNYLDHPNGTSRHLHFDVQVFTPDGWLWVNPYVTLVSAYERLLGGRGREIAPDSRPLSVEAHAKAAAEPAADGRVTP